MTSIMPPPPFLVYICTTLLYPLFTVILSVCLCLTIFPCTCILLSTLPSYFSLFPCDSFNLSPLSSCFYSSPACSLDPFPPPNLSSPPHTFSSFVSSVPFCRHYLRHHSHTAVPACLTSHHLSLHFFLFWKCSGGIQPVEGHLLADLTDLSVAITLAVAAGIAAM